MMDAVSTEHFNNLTNLEKRKIYCRIAKRELHHFMFSKLCPVFTCPRCQRPSVTASHCSGVDSPSVYFTCHAAGSERRPRPPGAKGCGKFSFDASRRSWLSGSLEAWVGPWRSASMGDAAWFV